MQREARMDRLGIEFLSVFNLPPVEFVGVAADLGCKYISLCLESLPYNPHNYPRYSLKTDAALRRETIAAMRDRGVAISLGEGFLITPKVDAQTYKADLDIMCALGVKRINMVSADPDLARTLDQFAILVEMADAAGVATTTEPVPAMTIGSLTTGLAALRHVNNPNFRLLIDTMHTIRSGSTAADIAALDPNLVGYAQLCDVPLVAKNPSYLDEAMYERLPPGQGELPLRDLLKALPHDIVVSLEIPQRALAESGKGPLERLKPCVDGARRLLEALDARN
jgi:sugar phosphate isomerase/epimerase